MGQRNVTSTVTLPGVTIHKSIYAAIADVVKALEKQHFKYQNKKAK